MSDLVSQFKALEEINRTVPMSPRGFNHWKSAGFFGPECENFEGGGRRYLYAAEIIPLLIKLEMARRVAHLAIPSLQRLRDDPQTFIAIIKAAAQAMHPNLTNGEGAS